MSSPSEGEELIGALDQGTSSTRFLVFCNQTGELVTYHQQEISLFYPQQGWVEQDPIEILRSSVECIEKAVDNLRKLEIDVSRLKAIGITNQRETTIVWDKETGLPLERAIVWLDTRTSGIVDELTQLAEYRGSRIKELCGLPLSTYFSSVKLKWLLEHSDKVRLAVAQNRCLFGTVDSWLLWNLTGGPRGGLHLTDVTNASRTMLMNLRTLEWDDALCRFFEIPRAILPAIRSSSEVYGSLSSGCLQGVPISGMLGDQQAALVGQGCLQKGQAKNTYGTGCFLLYNVGVEPVFSSHGLLTTIAFKFGDEAPCYALEGSVAIAGAAVRWLRDNLCILSSASDIESVALSVANSGGVYFVPAFSGLYAPHWDSTARGTICGMTQSTTSAHLARAVLESVCFQTREMIEAMHEDSGTRLATLQVDGGMTANSLLMQMQADLLGIDIVRPSMPETTALGAALAAARAIGLNNLFECAQSTVDTYHPSIARSERDARFRQWQRAVDRSKGWLTPLVSHEHNAPSLLPAGLFMMASFVLLVLSTVVSQ